jgi:hypothetical protein
VVTWNDEDVDVCDRVDVIERDALIVGVDFSRLLFAMDNLAKQAVVMS